MLTRHFAFYALHFSFYISVSRRIGGARSTRPTLRVFAFAFCLSFIPRIATTRCSTSPPGAAHVTRNGISPGQTMRGTTEARIVGAEGHLDHVQQPLVDLSLVDQALWAAFFTDMQMGALLFVVPHHQVHSA